MPKARLRELRSRIDTARLRVRRTGVRQNPDAAQDVAMILAGQTLQQAQLYQMVTVGGINDLWENTMTAYLPLMDDFIRSMPPEQLAAEAGAPDNGRALELSFRKFVAARREMPDGLEPRMYPTAAYRIDAIKDRMRRGEYRDIDDKRECLAQILAARDQVKAGRGRFLFRGSNLQKRLGPETAKKAGEFLGELRELSEEEIGRLYDTAMNRGHGGAMQEAFEELRRTPVEREMSRISRAAEDLDLNSEAVKLAAAQLLWLDRQKNLSKEEQQARLDAGTREEEILAVRNSPAFLQMFQNYTTGELFQMVKDRDLDGLNKALDEGQRDIDQSPFSDYYDRIMANPQERQKLQELLGRLAADENIQDLLTDRGATSAYFQEKLEELSRADLAAINKQKFVDLMERLQAHAADIRLNGSDRYAQMMQDPSFAELAGLLKLPGTGTVGEYAMALKSTALIDGPNGNLMKEELLKQTVLYEKWGSKPNWKEQPFTRQDMLDNEQRYFDRMDQHREKLPEYDREPDYSGGREYRRVFHVYGKEGPEASARYVRQWEEDLEKQMAPKTGRERLEELTQFPLKQKIFKSTYYSDDLVDEAFTQILAARAVARDAIDHPEKYTTGAAVDEAAEKYRRAINQVGMVRDFSTQQKLDLMAADRDGAELEMAYRKNLVGVVSQRLPEIDPVNYPTAKAQIEALQGRARHGDFTNKLDKCECAAQIIAAREVLKIRPGGDPKLNSFLTKKVFERANQIEEVLRRMPDADVDRIFAKVRTGHGGELMKRYREANTYASYLENQRSSLEGALSPKPKQVAEMIAARMQMSAHGGDANTPVDLAAVQSNAETLMRQPGFTALMADPATMELARQGDTTALIANLNQKIAQQNAPQPEPPGQGGPAVQHNAGGPAVQQAGPAPN